jgi:uncharacterized membrane protein YiaA
MTQRVANIVLSFAMFTICAIFLIETNKLSYPSNVFPYILIVLIAFFSTLILIQYIFSKSNSTTGDSITINYKRIAGIVAISLIYISVITTVGFYFATMIYLTVMCTALQSHERNSKIFKKIRNSFILSVTIVVLVYIVFNILLKVPAPTGVFI